MKKSLAIFVMMVFTVGASAQNRQLPLTNLAAGKFILDTKFDRNTTYKTGFTVDATVDTNTLFVRGDNWFPFHYIPSEGMKDYLVTVNCRLDKASPFVNGKSTGLNITKTILFEGYSPNDSDLKGIFLSQVQTLITDSANGNQKIRSRIVIGIQDEKSYDPITSIVDTADDRFHDYQMAYGNKLYYFFKDGKQLCIIDEADLAPALDPQANDHNVYVENNIEKNQNDFLQVKSVKLNELISTNQKLVPVLNIFEPLHIRDSIIVNAGEPLIFKAGVISNSNIDKIAVNGNDVEIQGNGNFTFQAARPPDKIEIKIKTNNGDSLVTMYKIVIRKQEQLTGHNFYPYISKNSKPRFHALLFACEKYSKKGLDELPFTIKDSKKLGDELKDDYQFSTQVVENPNYDTLIKILAETVKGLSEEDNLLLAFSGHGTFRDSRTKPVGYWIPSDGVNENDRFLSSVTIDSLLELSKSKHIIILSNTCFSGAFMGDEKEPNLDEKISYKYRCVKVLAAGGIQEIPSGCPFLIDIAKFLKNNADKHVEYFMPDEYLTTGIRNMVTKDSYIYPRLRTFGSSSPNSGTFYFMLKGGSLNFR